MTKRVAIFVATGSEPIEAIAPADVLRRGGVKVDIVSASDSQHVTLGHEVQIVADIHQDAFDSSAYDMIIIPGGIPGVPNLEASPVLMSALKQFFEEERPVAAICAAPMLLAHAGLLDGFKATCYPGVESELPPDAFVRALGVVIDRNLITASGPAYALPFGTACLEMLAGEDVADEVAAGLLMKSR